MTGWIIDYDQQLRLLVSEGLCVSEIGEVLDRSPETVQIMATMLDIPLLQGAQPSMLFSLVGPNKAHHKFCLFAGRDFSGALTAHQGSLVVKRR